MAILNRRDFVRAAGAAATLPLIGSRAFAQEKLKVGFIFLGPERPMRQHRGIAKGTRTRGLREKKDRL